MSFINSCKKVTLKSIFIVAAVLAGTFSCKLDLEPPGDILLENALKSADDIERAVNGLYDIISDQNILGGYYKYVPDLISDNIEVNDESRARDLAVYQRQLAREGEDTWNKSYNAINSSNIIIDYITGNKVEDISDVYKFNKDRLLGEAYFIRAVMNFELVRLWGFQYLTSGNYPIQQSGIVLLTSPTTTKLNLPRSSVNMVYESIESDLLKAIGLLPVPFKDGNDQFGYNAAIHPKSYQGRANADAARAYLIKVLFQKANLEDYKKLVDHADSLLGGTGMTGNYPLQPNIAIDYNPYTFTGLNKSTETIFQIINIKAGVQLSSTVGPIQNLYRVNPTNNQLPEYKMHRAGGQNFKKIYFENSNGDRRRILFDDNNFFLLKYDLEYQNIPIIRIPEIVLDRTEANFLLGNKSLAINDLTNLEKSRYNGNNGLLATIDSNNDAMLLDFIRKERVRELYGEGDRFHNLKRMAAFDRNEGKSVYNVLVLPNGARTSTALPILDARLLWEIPEKERFSNPLIVPNGSAN